MPVRPVNFLTLWWKLYICRSQICCCNQDLSSHELQTVRHETLYVGESREYRIYRERLSMVHWLAEVRLPETSICDSTMLVGIQSFSTELNLNMQHHTCSFNGALIVI